MCGGLAHPEMNHSETSCHSLYQRALDQWYDFHTTSKRLVVYEEEAMSMQLLENGS